MTTSLGMIKANQALVITSSCQDEPISINGQYTKEITKLVRRFGFDNKDLIIDQIEVLRACYLE